MSGTNLLGPENMEEVASRARVRQAKIISFIIQKQQDISGLVYGQVALGREQRVMKVLDMTDPRFVGPMGQPRSIMDELRRINSRLAEATLEQFDRDVRDLRMEEEA